MTEMFKKRFTIGNVLTKCSGLKDNGKLMTFNEVVNLLNELHEENSNLHIQNDFLKDENQHMRKLVNENEQLKQQLLYDGDDVCNICKHEYLVPSGDYYIAKCKKGHKGCSKEDVRYCEDFEKELKE